jgi:hypothetical protein
MAGTGGHGGLRLLLCGGEACRLARIAMTVITRAERIAAHRARGDRLKWCLLLLANLHRAVKGLTRMDPGVQNPSKSTLAGTALPSLMTPLPGWFTPGVT